VEGGGIMKRRYTQVEDEEQRAIVAEYRRGVRGSGLIAIAKQHKLPRQTVESIIKRAKHHGDPVTERGHKPRALDSKQEHKLVATLDRDPMATNRELAAAVGGAIAERTVSDYVARADPPFSTKVVQDQEPEEMSDDWKVLCRRWIARVIHIPLDTRVYQDESAIFDNEAKKKGRSRIGKPIFRPRSRFGKKYTLHVFARRTGVLFWSLRKVNASTAEVEHAATLAAENLQNGDTVIWDRLGRSGRAKHPVAQHYSPVARETFEDAGATLEFLPPKAKYFNPLELLFNDLKTHYIRPARPANGKFFTYHELWSIIDTYMDHHAPTTLPGFFTARANGATAFKNKLL
jgi:transposase